MVKIEGKNGIKARIICDSTSNNSRLVTYELTYPRFIHSELMTHRLFSRNASSSRAIPINKFLEEVNRNPSTPIYWGSNKPGMQAGSELEGLDLAKAMNIWISSSKDAIDSASKFNDIGLHKQVGNRILEPWQFMKTILSATEFDNFFKLRCHKDAQPEIHELANCMKKAYIENAINSRKLKEGDWHLPYVSQYECEHNGIHGLVKLSVARCARVSYKNHDNSDPIREKDYALYDALLTAGHMSPFEHIAKSISYLDIAKYGWKSYDGITHKDKKGNLWSGNFKGILQYRQLIEK